MQRVSDEPTLQNIADEISSACLGMRARLIDRVISSVYDRHLRPLGLRNTQVTLLTAIGGQGEVAPNDLATALAMDKSTVSRTIDRMIAQGWVEATTVDDGRSYRARLTTQGEQQLAQALPRWRAAQAELETMLGAKLASELSRVAKRLRATGP